MFKSASCCELSTICRYRQRYNSTSTLNSERMKKQVRFSVDLEEIRYYVPARKNCKPSAKIVKKLRSKAQKFRETVSYNFVVIQCGLENVKKQIQSRSFRKDAEKQRDYNWDELFEIHCTSMVY